MPFPDYLESKPKIIFFTDFDGTITHEDVPDWLVATEGFGAERLRQSNQAVMDGKMTYREACREQLESIPLGFTKCITKALSRVQLDPGFLTFYKWASSAGVPIVVLSGGLMPMIEAILSHVLGCGARSRIEVVANDVEVREGFESIDQDGGAWRVVYRDESEYGHDKGSAIMPYAKHFEGMKGTGGSRSILLFAGDGVSDLSALEQTDLLFAKRGGDLVDYCRRKQAPFTEFSNWDCILKTTQDL
ncbi:HAD-like domain-containing protein [Cercophora newfieldiana]|uniref:HAD-like domain-containing protein n=1 Tax=Cercophora newfieldiana TaxID=92897 RepID=A0AA39YV41_9PEZI|nr:HAD-like domain-containing protein [Cercophora newfieldiana]